MNIVDLLNRHVLTRPDAPVLIDRRFGRDRVLTFAQLEKRVDAVALKLQESGLRQGDRILVLQPVSAELYILLLAIFKANMIAMLLDPSAGLAQLSRICRSVPPDAVVFSAKTRILQALSENLRAIPRKFCSTFSPGTTLLPFQGRLPEAPPHPHPRPRSAIVYEEVDDNPALLSFTSGSTGEPKGIMRTQRFLDCQSRAVAICTAPQAGAVQMVSLPVFVLANIANGVTTILPDANLKRPGAINAKPVIDQMRRFSCTEVLASPAFVEQITRYCRRTNDRLTGVNRIFTGGAPVFGDLITSLKRVFPCAELEVVYGSTEAEPISHLSVSSIGESDFRAMTEGAGLLTGIPVECVEVAVIKEGSELGSNMSSDEFRKRNVPSGEPGEIFVTGEHVVKSYFVDDSGALTKVSVDGTVWHRTGDSGYIDRSGRLWLLGRSSARLQDFDGVLYPFAIESVARMQEAVEVVAVVPDRNGERLLVVQCRKADRDIVAQSLRSLLVRFSITQIVFLDRIPVDRRHNSKIDYPALKKILDDIVPVDCCTSPGKPSMRLADSPTSL